MTVGAFDPASHAALDAVIHRALKPLMARNRAFDDDTSMGHRPEAQARWWRKVQGELSARATRD